MTVKTHNRRVSSARVAEILRLARNLMNNGGRHWVKGDEKVDVAVVDPKTHDIVKSVSHGYWYEDNELYVKPTNEFAYCAIGAIKEVTGENLEEMAYAYIELMKSIDPMSVEQMEDFWKDNEIDHWHDEHECPNDDWSWDCECKMPAIRKPTTEDLVDYIVERDGWETAEEVIASNNDAPKTTWNDVSKWFTTAANRAKRRKV